MSRINVKVVYARPDDIVEKEIQQPPGTTLERAILASGILAHCPEIDLAQQKVGIYGRVQPLHTPLLDGDRVEIYRPVKAGGKQRVLGES